MDNVEQLRLVADHEQRAPARPAGVEGARREAASRPGRMLSEFGEVLTVEEAATVLRISRASAYEAARMWRVTQSEGLPVIQIGRRLLVPKNALEEMLRGSSPASSDRTRTARSV